MERKLSSFIFQVPAIGITALRLAGGRYETVADSTERIEAEQPIAVSAPLSTLFDPPG